MLDPSTLHARLDADELLLVDVREHEEHDRGHVAGSVDDGPVVPRQPPSRLGQITKNRSVSMRVLRQGRASFITFKLAE